MQVLSLPCRRWQTCKWFDLEVTCFFSLYFRSVNGRMRVGQEHKIVEVKGLEFYSRLFHGSLDLVTMNSMGDSYSASNIRSEGKHYYSILAPCDATLILSVWTSLVEPSFSIIPCSLSILLIVVLFMILTHYQKINCTLYISKSITAKERQCVWCPAYGLFNCFS